MNDREFFALFCAKKKGTHLHLVAVSSNLPKLEALMRTLANARVESGGPDDAQEHGWVRVLASSQPDVYPRWWIAQVPGVV